MRKSTYETSQKKLILDYLKENSDKYVSAGEIMEYLVKNNQKVGLTTIYRFLNVLENEGNLRVENIKNTRCFQYIEDDCKNHFHLKCEKCGKVEHLECQEMKELCKHIGAEHGFAIDIQNAINGVCQSCQAKEKEAQNEY